MDHHDRQTDRQTPRPRDFIAYPFPQKNPSSGYFSRTIISLFARSYVPAASTHTRVTTCSGPPARVFLPGFAT